MARREYIIENLFKENFITKIENSVCLTETEEEGRSELNVGLMSPYNYCIKNVDAKGMTDIGFFRDDKKNSMKKRVDHIIFEKENEDSWTIHLFEMKTTVGHKKWCDVKGKFRASVLLSEAIASMLEIHIKSVKMYTTYEQVNLEDSVYAPAARRKRVGKPMVRPMDEWIGKNFGLNFGERKLYTHTPIQMIRNEDGLHGTVQINNE